MNPFEILLTIPILNLLVFYYQILSAIALPGALGLAIILLTITVRGLLWPLTTAQLKSSSKLAALKPHMDRLKAEHGHDKIRHQQEITKLYKEHGVNPLAGCLPLLLQMPVFFALYNVLSKIAEVGKNDFLPSINSQLYNFVPHLSRVPDASFLSVSLAAKPSDWQQIGLPILLVPILTGATQLIQSKMMAPSVALAKEGKPALVKSNSEDTMAQVQSQMTLILPFMIAFFSYGFPIGLSLFWNALTIMGIIQQYVVAGPGALGKYLPENWRKL